MRCARVVAAALVAPLAAVAVSACSAEGGGRGGSDGVGVPLPPSAAPGRPAPRVDHLVKTDFGARSTTSV